VSSLVIPRDLMLFDIDYSLFGQEAVIRPPDQLHDVAPEAGMARPARLAPLLPQRFFLDQGEPKPKINEKVRKPPDNDDPLNS
jgi:hypothetical protein